jgi:hypothetical protein
VGESPHRPHHLALDAQRLAARGQQHERRAAAEQRVGQRGRALDHVLAVVEHHEQAPPGHGRRQRVGQGTRVVGRGRLPHAERGRHGRRRVGARREGGELHPPHAVDDGRVPRRERGNRAGHLAGEPGLPGPARTRQRDQPGAAEQLAHLCQLAPAPHEGGQGHRDVMQPGGGGVGVPDPARRGKAWSAGRQAA